MKKYIHLPTYREVKKLPENKAVVERSWRREDRIKREETRGERRELGLGRKGMASVGEWERRNQERSEEGAN